MNRRTVCVIQVLYVKRIRLDFGSLFSGISKHRTGNVHETKLRYHREKQYHNNCNNGNDDDSNIIRRVNYRGGRGATVRSDEPVSPRRQQGDKFPFPSRIGMYK